MPPPNPCIYPLTAIFSAQPADPSHPDDLSLIADKKTIRRIKNNEASRRYRARMREKRKEWAEHLKETHSNHSASYEKPEIEKLESPTQTRDFTCQTYEPPTDDLLNSGSQSPISLDNYDSPTAERVIKKQLYKVSRREKNNIAVRKYRHKRKQRIEQNKKELVYLTSRNYELRGEIELLKKQMSVLLAFEGIANNELLREVNRDRHSHCSGK